MIEFALMSRPVSRVIAFLLILLLVGLGACANPNSPEQLLASAKQERDKGHYRDAIIHLKSVLQQAPQNAEARYLLGETFNDAGDFKSAEAELRRAVELRYDLAKVKLGKALLMQGRYQTVLNELAPDPSVGNAVQAEILTLRALASFGLKRNNEGRELLKEALAKEPEFADALVAEAHIAAREKGPNEASQFIERAIVSAPKNVDAWMMKGDLAESRGDRAGALAAYQKILEFSPEYVPARVNFAWLQISAGDFEQARKQLDQINKLAPNQPVTKYLTALLAFREKKYTVAREAVLQALKAAPDYLPAMLLTGVIQYTLGEHAQAQTHLAQVVERVPGYLYARKLLVSSLLQNGQMQRAIEVLEPGLKQAPQDGELLALAGESYLRANEFAKAVQYYERAAKLSPKNVDTHTRLALSRLASGEPDRALTDLESAVQLDPERYQADLVLTTVHFVRGNFEQALDTIRSLEKKQSKNPLVYNLKGAIYLGKKDAGAARTAFERALEVNPTYVPAATNLAQLDLADKKPVVARRRLEAILEKDKNNVQALLTLASLGPLIGATSKEVIGWLERACTANPRLAQPQLLLARAYAQSGDPRKALEIAQQTQAAHPRNPEALDTLGGIQLATGANQQALASYNKLVELQPGSAPALLKLAMAESISGNQTRAAKTLRKAVSLQPDFLEAQFALAAFELSVGNYPAAMKIARLIQNKSPKAPGGFLLEGDSLMAEKKFPQAAKAYETAYSISRSGSVAMKLHAAYTQAGKPAEAEERLGQWLKESPEDQVVRLYSAQSSLKNGKYKVAIEHYEWLLKRDPDNALILNNLAWAYQQVKDARAVETAERAYKLKPDEIIVADTLGWMLVEQGDAKRGLAILEKAVSTAREPLPQYRYHLAQALLKTGDRAKARQELEKVVTASPDSSHGKDARKLLQDLGP